MRLQGPTLALCCWAPMPGLRLGCRGPSWQDGAAAGPAAVPSVCGSEVDLAPQGEVTAQVSISPRSPDSGWVGGGVRKHRRCIAGGAVAVSQQTAGLGHTWGAEMPCAAPGTEGLGTAWVVGVSLFAFQASSWRRIKETLGSFTDTDWAVLFQSSKKVLLRIGNSCYLHSQIF